MKKVTNITNQSTDPELVKREITLGSTTSLGEKKSVCQNMRRSNRTQGQLHRGVLVSHAHGLGFNAQNRK